MGRTSQRRSHWGVAVFLATFAVCVALDQWTKSLALAHLTTGSDVELLGRFVRLTLVHNPGASLGVGSGVTWVITLFAVLVSIVLTVLGLRTKNMWWSFVSSLTVAGALGNVIDRFMYSDGFLNYGPFVGNVADIVLTLAAVGIIGGVLFSQPFGIAWLDKLVYGGEDEREHGERGEKAGHGENTGRSESGERSENTQRSERGANSESGENTVLGESEAQN